MTSNPQNSSSPAVSRRPRVPDMPFPGLRKPSERVLAPGAGKDTGKTLEARTEPPRAIYEALSKIIPSRDLPLAAESFEKRFPGAVDLASVDPEALQSWSEDLPIAHV